MVNYPLFPPQNEDVVGFARTWWHLRQAGAGNGVLIDSNDPNGMKVTRASASSVNVAAGHYSNKGIWKDYAGASPAIETIPAASAGYHRYDSICVKLSDNTIVRVAGTEAVPDAAADFLENFTPLPADLNSTDYIELATLCIDENGIRSTDNGTYSVGGVCDTRPPCAFGIDDDTLTISADGKLASQIPTSALVTTRFWDAPAGSWQPPAANAAELAWDVGTNGSARVYKFDDTTEEFIESDLVVPDDIIAAGTVTIEVRGYALTAASSKYVQWKLYHSAKTAGEVWDAAYATKTSGDKACDASQDEKDLHQFTETVANLGWVVGDEVRLKLSRIAPSGTNLTGDYCVTHVRIKIPTVIT